MDRPIVRRLNLNDLDAYFANRMRALANAPTAFYSTLEEEQTRGKAHFAPLLAGTGDDSVLFGAVLGDGAVVGAAGVARETRSRVSHKATIWGVYVDEEFRGTGLGGELLDAAIAHARDRLRVLAIYLSVEATSPAAKRLYESRGFKTWGREPRAFNLKGEYFDEEHMTLLL